MDLQWRIECYIRESGVAPSRVGRDAVGDPHFVWDLRRGREMRPRIAAKVAAWLDAREQAR